MSRSTIAELSRITADREIPFRLVLPGEGGGMSWEVLELLRVLPGRRLVMRAHKSGDPEGQSVVLKLFLGRGRERYCRREARGLDRLQTAGLPVPARIGTLSAPGVVGLVLQLLPGVEPVRESDGRAMETLACYFGRLHAVGYRQTDLHLPNFVTSAGVIYAVDGDGVRIRPPGLGPALDNLALLAAQRGPAYDDGLPALLAAYARGRGIERPPTAAFQRRFARARRMRIRRYLAKTRRDCSEFAVRRQPGRVTYAVRGAGESALARLRARRLDASVVEFLPGEVLKAGNSATIVRADAVEPLVVKRFNIKSAGHGVRRMLRRYPRYRRAWMYGHLLDFLGIPTARPLALIEERRLFWRGLAYLVQTDLPGRNLLEEVGDVGLSDARCLEVATLFRLLRAAGLSHGDTKATNFIVSGDAVHLIDLDAMRLTGKGFESDVRRFLDNWAPPERSRFEAAFEGVGLL